MPYAPRRRCSKLLARYPSSSLIISVTTRRRAQAAGEAGALEGQASLPELGHAPAGRQRQLLERLRRHEKAVAVRSKLPS